MKRVAGGPFQGERTERRDRGEEAAPKDIKQMLIGGAGTLGLELTDRQVKLIFRFAELLRIWNARARLVADASEGTVMRRHVLDSLECVQAGCIGRETSIVDVGSGGGLPGIPLGIALGAPVTLVESTTKKTAFLRAVRDELGLDNVSIVEARAEEVGRSALREAFDCAVCRAVAPLAVVLEYCLPLTRVGGHAIAQKGAPDTAELVQGQAASELLGGAAPEVVSIQAPAADGSRCLVVTEKVVPTPEEYPRRSGMPAKRPLGRGR